MVSNAETGSQYLEKALNTNTSFYPRIKVLIVEDETFAAENIARGLARQGYNVVGIAESGEAAIQQANLSHPDIVLMDIMLQGEVDGIAAAQQIGQTLKCPIIYITSHTDDAILQRAKLTEPYGYLVKPLRPHDLRVSIEIALQRCHSERANQEQLRLQLQAAQRQLAQLSLQDPLTKLPNWSAIQSQFDQLASRLSGTGDHLSSKAERFIPVFCLSLDRLHRINHYWGYEASEWLLKAVAQRLTKILRVQGIVARTDINEFTIVFNPMEQRSAAMAFAQTVLDAIAQPFSIHGRELFVTASLGIALHPQDGEQLEHLVQRSRTVMDHLHQQGGNRYAFHRASPPKSCSAIDQLILETDLRRALERQELSLVYQPKVSLTTGQITGAEALLRWQHPQWGMISPTQFIPIAEESGMIESIGEWVLTTACQQLKLWHDSGLTHLRVAVNLSGRQLRQDHLHQRIMQILYETRLNPRLLELELTESILIEDVELAAQRLEALKAIGVQIAIDDFGTGYSSLSLLHRFLFDILKLDRCFVRGIHFNWKNRAIATAIISMAHQLNLKLVAEGVETDAELNFLHQHRCDEMQGYLFSRPVAVSGFEKLLDNNQCLEINSF